MQDPFGVAQEAMFEPLIANEVQLAIQVSESASLFGI